MKRSIFFIIVLCLSTWFLILYFFGESGVQKNIYQQKEILQLREQIWNAKIEIEEMTREYYRLKNMKQPDQHFLLEQGRKIDDIIIFKLPEEKIDTQKNVSIKEEKSLFIKAVIGAGILFLLGILGIIGLLAYYKTKNIQ